MTPSITASIALVCCAATIAGAQRPTIRDSAGIRIVTSAAPTWTAAQALRVDPTPQLVIGTQAGVPYELSQVLGAARLADGRIVIADEDSRQLRFYDPRGTYIKAAGGRGSGPGEFRTIRSLFHFHGDTLAVIGDGGKVTYFDGRGTYLSVVNVNAPPALPLPSGPKYIAGTFADGSLVALPFPAPQPRSEGARWIFSAPMVVANAGHTVIRPLGEIPISEVVMDGGDATSPRFGAPLSLANGDDAFFVGLGTEYSIRVYSRDGKLTRIIRRQWTPVRVTSADIDWFVVEWGKRWIKSTGAEADRARAVQRDAPYASIVPAFSQFVADRMGRLWVRAANLADAPGAGQFNTSPLVPSVWSVFDREGAWLGNVTLPAHFLPYDIGADYVVGVARDSDGVNTVVMLRLRAGS